MALRIYSLTLFIISILLGIWSFFKFEHNLVDFALPTIIFIIISIFFSYSFTFISEKGQQTTIEMNSGFWLIILTNPLIHIITFLCIELYNVIRDKNATKSEKFDHYFYNTAGLNITNTITYYVFYFFMGNHIELNLKLILVIMLCIAISTILSVLFYVGLLTCLGVKVTHSKTFELYKNGFIYKLVQTTPIYFFVIYFGIEGLYIALLITIILSVNTSRLLTQTVESIKNQMDLKAYKEIAYKDSLTGAFNRRYFDKEIEQIENEKSIVSIICTDIDKFKSINDGYNHSVGDQCLVQFTNIMSKHTPEGGVLIRAGGEEFTIIIRDNEEVAIKIAETIRKEVENTIFNVTFNNEETTLRFTASFGIGCFNPNVNNNFKESLEITDNHLYTAKKSGRNRVISAKI